MFTIFSSNNYALDLKTLHLMRVKLEKHEQTCQKSAIVSDGLKRGSSNLCESLMYRITCIKIILFVLWSYI